MHGRIEALLCALGTGILLVAACGDTGTGPPPVNRPPHPVGSIPADTVAVGDSVTLTVAAHFADPDGDSLAFTAASSDTTVATVRASGDSVTVTALARGTADITVTADDPEGLEAAQTFRITVPNRPPHPVGSIPADTVAVGDTVTVTAAAHFSDPDGDPLSIAAASSDTAVAGVRASGDSVTVTALAKGTAGITVTATDPEGLEAVQTFRITVPNRPPHPVGSIPADTVAVGDSVTLAVAAHFADPDGDPLAFAAASSDTAVAAVRASGDSITVTALARGTADITVTATDPEDLEAAQTFRITVPNQSPRPAGSIPDADLADGALTLDASSYFTDPEGDPLRYTAESSAPRVAAASVAEATVTVVPVARGSATITVRAHDPEGPGAATQVFGVTVPNQPPVRVGTMPDRERAAGTFTVDVAAYFSDPEGEALYYAARSENSRVATASASGGVVTVRPGARGTTTITVTARDPHGLEATQAFTVRVPNSAPSAIGRIPDIVVTEGTDSELALLPFFADPDGDALDFDAHSSDAGIVSTGIDGSNLQMRGEKVGSVTLTVTARDSGGLSAAHAFGVRVDEPPDGFDLQLAFSDSVPSSYRPAIRAAAAEWMTILADTELPDVPINSRLSCGGLRTVETVASLDDLLIMVHARGDAPRGTAAWASVCAVRSNPLLRISVT